MDRGWEQLRSRVGELGGSGGRLTPVTSRLRNRLRVDTRSLAALRILIGSILLIDLLHRSQHIEKYYTDSGVYTRAAYEATYSQFTGLSIHALSGDLWFQQLLFLLAGILAVVFILGYRTRVVGVLSFLLLLSLQARNPALSNGGDILLRTLFLLALLTPLGERWSVDALRRGTARPHVMTAATTALLAQPLVVFGQNAVLKHRGETWYAGDALEIAFANDVMTIYLGNYLHAFPLLLEVLNWLWITLLAGSFVFLFLTAGRLRAAVTLVYIGAFLGMLPTLMVGLFPLVLTATVLPYLTTPFWDTVGRYLGPSLRDYRPTADRLGRLSRPPLESRLFDVLRQRGYGDYVSYGQAYGRSLLTMLGVVALVFVLLFGVGHVADYDVPYQDEATSVIDQSWGLYAPDPSSSYSWYVVEAELADGSTVAAFGGNLSYDRPPDAAKTYESFRERKFMSAVSSSGADGIVANDYVDWACREAAETHDQSITAITVTRVSQSSPVDGEYDAPFERTVISRGCE